MQRTILGRGCTWVLEAEDPVLFLDQVCKSEHQAMVTRAGSIYWASPYSQHLLHTSSLTLHKNSMRLVLFCPHRTDEESEVRNT